MLDFKMILIAPLLFATAGAAPPDLAYPHGFRDWAHISSGYVGPGSPAYPRFGGIHNIYANPRALKGYAAGAFTPGSIIVFDVHEATAGPGSFEPGARRQVDVMVKTRSGWRFAEFSGDTRSQPAISGDAAVTQCATCHAKAAHDHVFSRYSD